MSFFQSPEFCQFVASILGGAIIGWKLAGWQARRENRRAVRTRQPQYIEVPFVGHGGRQVEIPTLEDVNAWRKRVETLTCDRRR